MPLQDKHCLNPGEDWKAGFMRGISNSLVIVILVSAQSIQGIIQNAATKEDNYLLEIETALARHDANQARVLPVFIGQYHEIEGQTFLQKFDSLMKNVTLDSLL